VCEDDELGCGEIGGVGCEGDAGDFSEITKVSDEQFNLSEETIHDLCRFAGAGVRRIGVIRRRRFESRFSGGFATATAYTFGKGMGFQFRHANI
jgi:hypothetical protein